MTVQKQHIDQEQQDALNERAEKFTKNFANADYESGQAQNFVRELCGVYGLDYLRSVEFEHRVRKADGKGINRIDGFFAGLLLVEMKSKDKNLDEAYQQALDYIPLLKNPADAPRHILISDFQNLHLYDVSGAAAPIKFKLADFKQHIGDLDFLLGYERILQQRQEHATIEAANRLGNLHDAIKNTGYAGDDLQTLLVRLLFCLFADDTNLFTIENAFHEAIAATNSAGNDLGDTLRRLFKQLDYNPKDKDKQPQRTDGIYEYLLKFPYVNGELFTKAIEVCDFDAQSRKALLDCCELDWSAISPDIFGTLFQHIMHWDDEAATDKGGKTKKRRDFGAHYTSERNIRRAIDPLFMDDLKSELTHARGDAKKLNAFIKKLQMLNIFDPACGCGNFLVVAYREIRSLEQQAMMELNSIKGSTHQIPLCDVHQFHGIEIDPTAAEIATVALWLTDHQMNQRWDKAYRRLPLKNKANIVCANALRTDWQTVIAATRCDYIVGNPPFLGYTQQSKAQKEDMALIYAGAKGAGVLDYVTAWYVKAWQHIQANPATKAAFVSTNSITQGEQVAILWQPLMNQGLHIHFAHRTFKWNNEGSGVAAVHCVIVGFGADKPKKCAIWDYSDDIAADGKLLRARRINPYLADAPAIFLSKRSKPLCAVSEMTRGSQPTDGGNLLLSDEERSELLSLEPTAEQWLRPFSMGDEFINNIPRWCLWLHNITPDELNAMPLVAARVEAVKQMRLSSPKIPTQKLAEKPTVFGELRQPNSQYLALPRVSSERRRFIPIGFMPANHIAGDKIQTIENATLYHFGMLCATMHNAWMRTTCGRMKSDYSYSNTIVYNNYPWAQQVDAAQIEAIETAAQGVLDARAAHAGQSLAWLYNPDTMPSNLKSAHDELDDAVDEAYGYMGADDDAPRVAFLFELYQKITAQIEESSHASTKKLRVKPAVQ
jgi:type I restriction-modification system DNA methylase subunit